MAIVVGLLGVLQMIGGIAVTMMAKSAVHEILGAVSFGMGVLALGIGVMIAKADRQVQLLLKLTGV